jgi:hypothetical protein
LGFGVVTDPSCEVINIRTPDGRYRQVLRGQIPPDWMDEFVAAGSPTSLGTNCLVNYGFLATEHAGEDWTGLLVFTPSIKHFTASGAMVEVCEPS